MGFYFWAKPVSASGGNLPAEDADLKATEKRLGIKLPPTLVELFRIKNGGRTVFETYTLPDNDLLRLEEFMTLKEIGDECEFGLEDDDWSRTIKHTDKLIVIARHGYGTFLCLDYRSNTGEPSIVLIDAVLKPKEAVQYASFLDFIQHLQQETEQSGQ